MKKKLVKIEIGHTLPAKSWFEARDYLAQAFPFFGEYLRKLNFNGKGEQDKEEFLAEAQLAIQALTYVGEFAADKCRIIVLPDQEATKE